jgi:DNA-binding CsgD family transcriptional regulator
MRLDSIKFGVVQGLSIPIHGPREDFAILLLVQKKGQRCLDNWQDIQYELFSAAYCYYFYAEKLLLKTRPKINKHDLTERELECLTLIAQENPVEVIAKKLKITPRTVHYYSQRINKKLGTRNKYQSVLKALQKNLIHL